MIPANLAVSFFLFLVFPSLKLAFDPRPLSLVPKTAWASIILIGLWLSVIAGLALTEFLSLKKDRAVKVVFLSSLLGGSLIIFLLMTTGNFNLLYWDSYHVVRLTSETVIGDWRSFFFEVFSFYALQFFDHVYSVNLFAVFFYLLAVNLPILWCKDGRCALMLAGLAGVMSMLPHFVSNAAIFFTDTFFASFSIIALYCLVVLVSRFNSSVGKIGWNDFRAHWPMLTIFLLASIAAVNFRHNGIVLGVFLCFGLLFFIRQRSIGVVIAVLLIALLFGMGQIKKTAVFPDASPDSIHTNRNFQKIALVLNLWGAMLSSDEGYTTPSKEKDMEALSYFMDPEVVRQKYDPKNPVVLWQIFATPWRNIDDKKTRHFMQLSVRRALVNLPLFIKDRGIFISNMLLQKDTVFGIEKDCAAGLRSVCPSFGPAAQNEKYNSQINNFVVFRSEVAEKFIVNYLDSKFSSGFLLSSLLWFVILIFFPGQKRWGIFLGLYGLTTFGLLVLTLPSPEFRYFFPVTLLFFASLSWKFSGRM